MPDINLANSGESIKNFGTVVNYPFTTGTNVEYDGRVNDSLTIGEVDDKYSSRWKNIDPNTPQ